MTPNALQQYVAAGSRRSTVPLSNHDNTDFDDRELFHFSGVFETEVQTLLASNLPDVLPVASLEANQSHSLTVPADLVKRVRELGSQPAQWWNRMPNAVPSPFRNRADEFIGARLVRHALEVAQPPIADQVKGVTTWDSLFDGPEKYRECINAAWKRLSAYKIVTSRTYSVGDGRGGTCRGFFELPYSQLGVSLATVEPLVF